MIYETFIAIFLLLINYLFGKSNRTAYILALIYSIIMVMVYIKSTVYIAALNQAEAAWLYIYGYIRSGQSGRKTTKLDKNAYILSSILSIGMGIVIYSIRWKSEWTGWSVIFNSLNLEMLINTGSTIMLFLVARGRIEAYYVAALVNLSVATMLVSAADTPKYVLAAANGFSVIFYWGAVRLYYLLRWNEKMKKIVISALVDFHVQSITYKILEAKNTLQEWLHTYMQLDQSSVLKRRVKSGEWLNVYALIPVYFEKGIIHTLSGSFVLKDSDGFVDLQIVGKEKRVRTIVIEIFCSDIKHITQLQKSLVKKLGMSYPLVAHPPEGCISLNASSLLVEKVNDSLFEGIIF